MQSMLLQQSRQAACRQPSAHSTQEAWQLHASTGCGFRSSAPYNSLTQQNRRLGSLQICQAHPRRVAKVASQIRREIGEMLILDDVVAAAVCPERRRGFDGALSALASVTDVYVSNDLQFVKAYISIYSDPEGRERAMANLKRLEPYVRSQIGRRVGLRLTPEVRFEVDNTMEEYDALERALGADEIARYQREAREEAGLPPGDEEDATSSSSAPGAAPAAAAAAAAGDPTAVAAAEAAAAGDGEDEGGFFDEVGEEDDGWEEEEYGAWASRPGPFDDLFTGRAAGPLLQEKGGKKKGGRKQKQK